MRLQRREFLAVLGGALFPFAAHAQEPGRVYRLGIVIPATRESIAGFFDELRMAGFVEGQNLTVTGFYSVPGDKSDDAIAAVVKTCARCHSWRPGDLCTQIACRDADDPARLHERGSRR